MPLGHSLSMTNTGRRRFDSVHGHYLTPVKLTLNTRRKARTMTEQHDTWTSEYRPGDDIRALRDEIAAGEHDFALLEAS